MAALGQNDRSVNKVLLDNSVLLRPYPPGEKPVCEHACWRTCLHV